MDVLKEIPTLFPCPITNFVFEDPVVMKDGQIYERGAITDALKRTKQSPITRQELSKDDAVANFTLKSVSAKCRSTSFPIKITLLKGAGPDEIEVKICYRQTIEKLKTQITDKNPIPAADQTIKVMGQALNDRDTIFDSSISPSDFLQLEW
jgi:hypothetical protein